VTKRRTFVCYPSPGKGHMARDTVSSVRHDLQVLDSMGEVNMKSRQLCGMGLWVALAVLSSSASAQAETITHGGTTINMDFVHIGNPGNPVDTRYAGQSLGAVGYAYRIGTFEVTADQWAAVIAADPNVGNTGYWSGLQPTGGASWNEAARFCNWLTTGDATNGYYSVSGGTATPNGLSHDAYAALHGTTYFLPTEDEWYKAAYYDGSTNIYCDYPTGSNSLPTPVAGGTAVGTAVYNVGGPANVNNAGGLSPYGTMGQGGNLWEWNETMIDSSRELRGGAFYSPSTSLHAYSRPSANPSAESNQIGVRVSIVPEPSNLFLAIGAIVGLVCWRYWR
jgi:formylglycine-generating enzyme